MTRDELLAALMTERYDNRWWTLARRRAEQAAIDDSDVACARRRRQLASDYERANIHPEAAS